MAIGADNAGRDVLENDRRAGMPGTDVDWHPPETKLRNLVLVPILADHRTRARGR
jgi:hypothetical protein